MTTEELKAVLIMPDYEQKEEPKPFNKKKCIKKASHCIGLGESKPYRRCGILFFRPYRNYYAAIKDDQEWALLYAAGYAGIICGNGHGGYTFYLTRKGLDWLGKELGVQISNEEK